MTVKNRQNTDNTDPWLQQVQQQVELLRHGVIRLVIRSARIVQVEQTEQRSLVPSSQSANGESFVTDWADS